MLQQRESMLDTHARALAGVQGRPPESEAVDDDDEYAAWTTRDPKITPEHLQQIAVQATQELMQQTNDDGSRLWTDQQIADAVKLRQTLAEYPYRHLTYTIGVADLDEQIAKAEQVAKQVARRQEREMAASLEASGWEPMTEMPERTMPALPASTEGAY